MKDIKRFHIMSLVIMTAVTVLIILSMMPNNKEFAASQTKLVSDLGDIDADHPWGVQFYGVSNEEEDEYVVDQNTLDQFIKVYVKEIKGLNSLKDLTPLDKEEVRLILEDMGYNNTTRLKNVLAQTTDEWVVKKINEILDENLFDYDMERLDIILLNE